MAVWTTSDLVSSVKQRGQLTDTTNTENINAAANLLKVATEELRITIVPLVVAGNEEYYVATFDISVVAGQARYPVPTRSIGNGLRSIRLVNGSTDMPFEKVDPDQTTYGATGTPCGYYFEDNNIVLYPTPTTAGPTIKTRIYQRPNRLEQVSNCAVITAINTATNIVTVSSAPSAWGTGTLIDMAAKQVPYACRAIDKAISSVSGTDITFASLPSDLVVGDYLCPAEYTCLPQIPEEFQPVLVQATLCIVLQALKDMQGLANAMKTLDRYLPIAEGLLSPRDESHPKKVVGSNWTRRQIWG